MGWPGESMIVPALLLLRYKEAFRPDFEAWKKRNPQAIRAFIQDYGLRP
jgi:hypothetical protein